jgi:hypothetical protein
MQFASLLMLLFMSDPSQAAPRSLVPMFIVERTTNSNVVHYDARLSDDGEIDSKDPIAVYWTIGSAEGKRQDLSFLERRMAWGLKIRKKADGRYSFSVVSLKQIEINVYRQGGLVRAQIPISGSPAYLRKIFVNIDGPLFSPNVNYIDLFGTDITTGVDRHERITPPR